MINLKNWHLFVQALLCITNRTPGGDMLSEQQLMHKSLLQDTNLKQNLKSLKINKEIKFQKTKERDFAYLL